jgi:hypothetical protein
MGNKFITVGLNGREMFLKSKVDGASVRITIGPGLRRTLVRQEIQQLVTFPGNGFYKIISISQVIPGNIV